MSNSKFFCNINLFAVFQLTYYNVKLLNQLIVRHYKVYYPVRHHLIPHMVNSLQRLGFTSSKKETILSSFKPLQRGIAACMTCPNTKVIRGVHTLLSRLMSFFPTEPATSNVASKYEELECLYACVSKVVYEGLTAYEKDQSLIGTELTSKLEPAFLGGLRCNQHHIRQKFVETLSYLGALSQLNHSNTELTHVIWIDLFPRIWKILSEKQQQIERLVEVSSQLAIKEWRRLPNIVSHIHVPLLQYVNSSTIGCMNNIYLLDKTTDNGRGPPPATTTAGQSSTSAAAVSTSISLSTPTTPEPTMSSIADATITPPYIELCEEISESFLIEEKCRFLSNFSQHTAEVELPGEFLLPKKQEELQPGAEPTDMEGEQLITMVNKAVSAITTRLHNLATFEGAESRVNVHTPIEISLKQTDQEVITKCSDDTRTNEQKINDWTNEKSHQFLEWLNLTEIENINSQIEGTTVVTQEIVHMLIGKISKGLIHSAGNTFGFKVSIEKKSEHKKNKPLFDYDCRVARSEFRKMKRNKNKSPFHRALVLDAEKRYKNPINKAHKKYRSDFRKKMDDLKQKDSEEFLRLLNENKSTAQPKIDFDKLVSYFKELNSDLRDDTEE
ncbi:TRRAP [Mytilus edulis]|uniref:TRRAP n=1 Tax=Mytilus edulis TaxID=6550 RepID=A0A8S3V0W4_MYTED|nr:TRRAP [Mytilus edulis]